MGQEIKKLVTRERIIVISIFIILISYFIYYYYDHYYPREFAALVDYDVDFDKIVIEKGTSSGRISKRDADKKKIDQAIDYFNNFQLVKTAERLSFDKRLYEICIYGRGYLHIVIYGDEYIAICQTIYTKDLSVIRKPDENYRIWKNKIDLEYIEQIFNSLAEEDKS